MSIFDAMELPPEKEKEMIEKAARYVVNKGMEIPALIALESFLPVAFIGTSLGIITLSPFLSLFGNIGFNTLGLLRKRSNIEELIKRIETLRKEKT